MPLGHISNSKNIGRDARLTKATLQAQLKDMNTQVDFDGLEGEGCAFRYHIEERLLHILNQEEEYWWKNIS